MKKRAWESAPYWLVPKGMYNLISFRSQDHLLSGVTAHKELDFHSSIFNQENEPQACQSYKGIFSKVVHSSRMTVAFVMLTKTNEHSPSQTPTVCSLTSWEFLNYQPSTEQS